MKKASALYMHYVRTHQQQGPKDEADFKKHLDSIPKDELAKMGVDNIEEALTSKRDNQKFVVVYGINMRALGPMNNPNKWGGGGMAEKGKNEAPKGGGGAATGPTLVMYEKVGKGGKRWVAYAQGGSVVEMDEESFKKLVPNPQ
jgi:hypothetical protein